MTVYILFGGFQTASFILYEIAKCQNLSSFLYHRQNIVRISYDSCDKFLPNAIMNLKLFVFAKPNWKLFIGQKIVVSKQLWVCLKDQGKA